MKLVMCMLITSLNNDKVKELVKLKEKKHRDKMGLFFVEGVDLVTEAYKNSLIEELYVLDGCENIFDMNCTYVSYDVMKKISDMESVSEYFALCKKIEEKDIGKRIILLDDIQDPGNLGTIIRSSVAFNFDTVVVSKKTVDLYNPKTIRSTKGMIFNQNVIVRDLVSFLNEIDNYVIYGTDVVNGVNIREEEIPSNVIFVIGNEGKGISEEVRALCDKFIYIGMNDKCESLNASVAASIIMHEVNSK